MNVLLTEDITPIRICLLLLVSLYSGNQIPEECCRPLMTVVVRFLEDESLSNDDGELLLFPGLLELIQQVNSETLRHGNETNANSWTRLFLSELWSIKTVDDLDAKVKQAESFLSPKDTIVVQDGRTKAISPRSFLGGVIQKLTTTYKLLQFDEVFLFFASFVDFRAESHDLYVSLGGTPQLATAPNTNADVYTHLTSQLHETLGISITAAESHNTTAGLVSLSKSTTQALLEKQVILLETYGGTLPLSMRQVLSAMALQDQGPSSALNSTFSQTPSYYYANYLQNLHESNYHGALDSLHQYFDYMVSNNSKYFYHFALISRASLHQYFGEYEQALDAIEEAISVARENKDNSTLTFILSWLYNLMKCKPELWKKQSFYHNNNASHLLDFLVTKSQSVSLSLHCMSFLYETVHIMDSAGTMGRYLESLVKALYLSLNDSKPTYIRALEMATAVWGRIGQPHLSDLYISMASDTANETGKLSDEVTMEIRRCFLRFAHEDGDELYKKVCALQKVVNSKDQALENVVKMRCVMLLVELHLRNGRLFQAKELVGDLCRSEIHENDVRVESVYLSAKVEMALGNYARALAEISSFSSSFDESAFETDLSLYGLFRLKLLQCTIYNETGNPSRAFSLLMSQLVRARDVGCSSIVSEGIVVLASVQANLGGFQDSYNILTATMPRILANYDVELASSAYYELAAACYGMARAKDTSIVPEKDLFNKFLRYLNASIKGFKTIKHSKKLLMCFKLEQSMATFKENNDLVDHAHRAITKLNAQLSEECVKMMV
ncbi:Anaphase-promoting complex subunit 5 [Meyerozyma sp. JA9]|nr:Anaphase-promoting complex subunit 5 [Meyerozyma sp. JA9]